MPPIYVIIGVAGSGKTTIGEKLAKRLSLPFYDADDFHPESNIKKMQSGSALDDQDRRPWLQTLAKSIAQWQKKKGAVLACSALKEDYRTLLQAGSDHPIQWIYLDGSFELIKERIKTRKGHFFKEELLLSQFNDLEVPKNAISVSIIPSVVTIVNAVIKELN